MKKYLFKPPFLPSFVGGKYHNYDSNFDTFKKPQKWIVPSIKMYVKSRLYAQKQKPDRQVWIQKYQECNRSKESVVTWLGHATMLIQIENLNIITDPIITSPSWFFKRILPFGAEPQSLPSLDVVLISHNHWDHMDAATLMLLHKQHDPLFLVPEGNKSWFLRRGITKVEEFSWWQTWEQNGVDFTFVPAWHWSQRGLFDHNKSLWGGWVIQGRKETVFFAGDTAYNKHYFKTIGEMFPNIDIGIMPIGPCDPDEFMRASHMNAQQSGQAFLDCGAQSFIPMHWGTFYFGVDSFQTPIERLNLWWDQNEVVLQNKQLFQCKIGQQLYLEYHKSVCLDKHDPNRYKLKQ